MGLKRKIIRNYADRRLCVCGHQLSDHTGQYDGKTAVCMQMNAVVDWCQCNEFKLDNLAYVEQLAAERGLI